MDIQGAGWGGGGDEDSFATKGRAPELVSMASRFAALSKVSKVFHSPNPSHFPGCGCLVHFNQDVTNEIHEMVRLLCMTASCP